MVRHLPTLLAKLWVPSSALQNIEDLASRNLNIMYPLLVKVSTLSLVLFVVVVVVAGMLGIEPRPQKRAR